MDPLSLAMSIVGLLKAGEQISSKLQSIVKKAMNAPKEIKEMTSTIETIRTVLCQLQLMLLGQSQVSSHRTSLIMVDQIVITLSACVTTFSDLNIFAESLGTNSKMGFLDRMRWATETSAVKEHLHKLEVHKSSLTLIMTILTCESTRAAEDAVDVLSTNIQFILDTNVVIAQRLAAIEVGLGATTELKPFAESKEGSQVPGLIQTNVERFAFEEELTHSWVYKRAVRRENCAFSIITSTTKTGSWSMLSGLSLKDNISIVAVQALPIYEEDISNSALYEFGDFIEEQTIPNGGQIKTPSGTNFFFKTLEQKSIPNLLTGDDVDVPARPVTLELPRPPSSDRSRTQKHRTTGSSDIARPKTRREFDRPPSKRIRPQSSGRPKTSERGPRYDNLYRSRSGRRNVFPTIQEQDYTEEPTILKRLKELNTLIDEHVLNFYSPLVDSAYSADPDINNPITRHYALRRYIFQRFIHEVIMVESNRIIDIHRVANSIAEDISEFANSQTERFEHLISLGKVADKLKRNIENHPSDWEFDSQDEQEGYITIFPAVLRDGEPVMASQRGRIS